MKYVYSVSDLATVIKQDLMKKVVSPYANVDPYDVIIEDAFPRSEELAVVAELVESDENGYPEEVGGAE